MIIIVSQWSLLQHVYPHRLHHVTVNTVQYLFSTMLVLIQHNAAKHASIIYIKPGKNVIGSSENETKITIHSQRITINSQFQHFHVFSAI